YVGMSERNPRSEEGPAADTGSAAPTADTSLNGRSREVPVTEDTMTPTAESAPAEGEAAPMPMPGVMPMPSAEDAEATMPAAAASASSGAMDSTGSWATSALSQLEEAQQAMAKGDWVAYGQTMSSLKAFLESVAEGAPPMAGQSTAPSISGAMPPPSMTAEGESAPEAAE